MEFGAPPVLCASAATGGKKETEGPLAPYFDILNKDTKFRQDSWEKAESRMQQETLQLHGSAVERWWIIQSKAASGASDRWRVRPDIMADRIGKASRLHRRHKRKIYE